MTAQPVSGRVGRDPNLFGSPNSRLDEETTQLPRNPETPAPCPPHSRRVYTYVSPDGAGRALVTLQTSRSLRRR